jgi:PAS domain S-box-containing protein
METYTKNEFYNNYFENLIEGCQIISPDWRYLYVNNAACKQAHKTKKELLGRRMMDVFPGIENTIMFETLRKCIREQCTATLANEYLYPNSDKGWFQLCIEPVVEGLLVMSFDITHRKKMEERVDKLNRVYKVLSGINEMIVRVRGIDAILEAACHHAVENGGFEIAWVGLLDKSSHKLNIVARAGEKSTNSHFSKININLDGKPVGYCTVDCALREKRHMVCNDILYDASQRKCQQALFKLGCHSCASFPLFVFGSIRGAISFYAAESDFFDEEILGLLDELAVDLSFAMEYEEHEAERKQAEEVLRETEETYQVLFEGTAQGILVADIETRRFKYANPAICRMLGYTKEELTQLGLADIHPPDVLDYVIAEFESQARGEKSLAASIPCIRKDGSLCYTDITTTPNVIHERTYNVGFFTDVTEHRELEKQLQLSQRLETVGRLTGGIAHDFNNALTAIIGYTDFILMKTDKEDENHQHVQEIKKAGERAAALTHQLLAFSRKQVLKPEVLDPNNIIKELEKMIRRIIGEDIKFVANLKPDVGRIKADPAQMEQIIMNLAINARDAMSTGGKLTIETANVFLDEGYADHHVAVKTGTYVMLAVSDNGVGMDKETQEHIFEPFFSTKGEKGTGLGLSTVYGIVKQSGGNIWVYSEPGQGTTFKIYFPRVEEGVVSKKKAEKVMESLKGTETILVVEDESTVRSLINLVLKDNGYTILEASNGPEALSIFYQNKDQINLLLTDAIMPGMNGRELAEQITAANPTIKVLYASGYTDNVIVHHGILEEGINFLQKPFAPSLLLSTVRMILDKVD